MDRPIVGHVVREAKIDLSLRDLPPLLHGALEGCSLGGDHPLDRVERLHVALGARRRGDVLDVRIHGVRGRHGRARDDEEKPQQGA